MLARVSKIFCLPYAYYQYRTYSVQQQVNWKREFGRNHVDVMVGHENYDYLSKVTYGMNTNMVVEGDNYLVMGNFINNSSYQGYNDSYRIESYLARGRYNFDEKYYLDASIRRDGSSRFHPNHRWGNFYSFGGSWNIIKEEFMSSVEWVNSLRLRASYGEVGNDLGVSYYGYMALYSIDKNAGEGALVKQALAADDIKWETTQTVDLGIEGRFFNRLSLSLGYFDKRSKDLLFEVKLPLSAGSNPFGDNVNMSVYKNIGSISNRGIELTADVDILNKKDWKWSAGVDATFLKSKIVKLPEGKDILNGLHRYSEGKSVYEFWTYHYEGVDQMTGKSLYTIDPSMAASADKAGKLVSINGKDYTTDTAYGLRDWAGSAIPTVYGSLKTNASWKDLSLNVLLTYSLGGKAFDNTYSNLMSTPGSSVRALHTDALKSWSGVPEGMTEDSPNRIDRDGIPALDNNLSATNNATSDRWLVNASYLAIKNINMSYRLPKKLLTPIGVENLSVTAGVENLFTFTARKGLNPQATFGGYSASGQANDTYVTARVYNIALTLKF